ncbi:MAG: ATP-binding protein [Bacteroidota bacterium]|nr:ATP-binding protein [Bacteroidota bacterium]MDP4196124.1 ATP-binding protein [Bacteroidota bacterium]
MDETEQRYQRLLRYLTDYIYTVKVENGTVVDTYHGPGCYAVTGYTSSDYDRDPNLWVRMVHVDDRKAVTEQARQALAGEDVQPLEHRIIHRNGSIRWIKNSIVLSKNAYGQVIGYDGMINNITERKKAEELTALKQKQLIQADKMASLGILVSGIAHEISNPNNFILLNAQFFSKVWNDTLPLLNDYYENNGDFVLAGIPFSQSIERINQALNGILIGSKRIGKIVKSLTDFARQDAGELNQEVDIRQVVDISVIIVNNLIKNSTDYFAIDYAENIPKVRGNKQQLEQVMINLITNACQSLEDKKQKITISTGYDRDKDQIIISVKDEGKGIDPKSLKYILDPFYTTKREMGGTGLGLSITYNIIKKHGGDLTFLSELDEGTTATVTLPAFSEQPEEKPNGEKSNDEKLSREKPNGESSNEEKLKGDEENK